MKAIFKTLKDKIGECALNKEYKILYNKVVPPVATCQTQLEEYMTEHEQMKAIIRGFDETIGVCALKHEIIEYAQELRYFCKSKDFIDYKIESAGILKKQNAVVDNVNKRMLNIDDKIEEEVHRRVSNAMNAFKMKQLEMKEKDSGAVDSSSIEMIKLMTENMQELLASKADCAQVADLAGQKTNKIDSQA